MHHARMVAISGFGVTYRTAAKLLFCINIVTKHFRFHLDGMKERCLFGVLNGE